MFAVQSEIHYLPANCLEGRNLCTPPDATIHEKAPGNYHVVLPAHLEWGASIPNPHARPVRISNPSGSVCSARTPANADACAGPGGVPSDNLDSNVRASLSAPDSNLGALVTKTDNGRTWFSVNSRKGPGFTRNQGFFEFDVRLN